MLKTDDYRRLLATLEGVERADSLSAFRRATLESMAEHLGYDHAMFLTGTTDEPGVEGTTVGYPQRRLDALLTRARDLDVTREALAMLGRVRTAPIALNTLQTILPPGVRQAIDEYLTNQRIGDLLGVWLDPNGATHGFVALLSGSRTFGSADAERLSALEPHLSNLLARHVPRRLQLIADRPLTPREAEAVDLVAAGCNNRVIAERLGVSESTVKKHVSSALAKLGVTSRTQLTLAWLDPESLTGRGSGFRRR